MSYIGNQPTSVAFVTDQFSGNGSTVAFTTSVAPANTASVLVSVSGVLQDPTTYSVSGLTLTFSAAPPSGTGNISCRYLGIPASGVTTTAYRTVTEFTATASQTTFTPASYTVGFIDVYRNGTRLGTADFTATNGTTVVLASGASSGDLVTTESFFVSSVVNAIPATTGAVISSYLLDGAVTTVKVADANVTPAKLSQPFTSMTAQASTSGTSIDFTSIPSWVKRITVMFSGVSTNGSSLPMIQLGDSGGVETTGYTMGSSMLYSAVISVLYTTGFTIRTDGVAGTLMDGFITLNLFSSSTNTWVAGGTIYAPTPTIYMAVVSGAKSLSATLDRVRITTVNGTDAFDAGSVNILYE
jgi:hypothetical protein